MGGRARARAVNRRVARLRSLMRPPARHRALYEYDFAQGEAVLVAPPPEAYAEAEAALDALSGHAPCDHGMWPHQGSCEKCLEEGILRLTSRRIFLTPIQVRELAAWEADQGPGPK